MRLNGNLDGQLSFVITTNEALGGFVPTDRYTVKHTADKLALSIQSKHSLGGGTLNSKNLKALFILDNAFLRLQTSVFVHLQVVLDVYMKEFSILDIGVHSFRH